MKDPLVAEALEKIEDAQRLIERAAEDLVAVGGYAEAWQQTLALHEIVKRHWQRVNLHEVASEGSKDKGPGIP